MLQVVKLVVSMSVGWGAALKPPKRNFLDGSASAIKLTRDGTIPAPNGDPNIFKIDDIVESLDEKSLANMKVTPYLAKNACGGALLTGVDIKTAKLHLLHCWMTRLEKRTSFSAICWAILSLSSANCCFNASVFPKMSSSLGGGARSSSDMELMAASWAGVKVARRLGSW